MLWGMTAMNFFTGLLLAAVCDREAGLLKQDFGETVQLIGSMPCSASGDFNGDGVSDTAWVARSIGALKSGVRTENPWRLAPTPGTRGVAVALSGNPKRLYFLADSDFFGSPIWQHPESLLNVRRQGKGHVLLVATESGEDMRLIFDGRSWSVRP